MKFISDELWSEVESLFSSTKKTKVGRPTTCDHRQALEGIMFVMYTGCQWKALPKEYGCRSTVHGKLMKWCKMGVFEKIMSKSIEYYHKYHPESNWFALDTTIKKAPFADFGGKNPTDRAKQGIKEAILVDRKGAPMAVFVTAANVHDSKLLEPIVQQLVQSNDIRIIAADSAFDAKNLYTLCTNKNIALVTSTNRRRKKNAHVFHAPYRWIVEQVIGILSWFRGLKFCWNKLLETRTAFLQLACSYRLFRMV